MKTPLIAAALLAASVVPAFGATVQLCDRFIPAVGSYEVLIKDFGNTFAVYRVSLLQKGIMKPEYPVVTLLPSRTIRNTMEGLDPTDNAFYQANHDANTYSVQYADRGPEYHEYTNCKPANDQQVDLVE